MLEAHPHEHLSGPAPVSETEIPEHTIAQDALPEPPDRHRQEAAAPSPIAPLPIATSGELTMMPPATGLPVARSTAGVTEAFDSIPQASTVLAPEGENGPEIAHHG